MNDNSTDITGWVLRYDGYDPQHEGLREALCTTGNGYFCTRGAAADSDAAAEGPLRDVHYPGTYLAGGYDRQVTKVEGRDVENEDLVNLPNWLPLTFRVGDGPWFRIDDVQVEDYCQALDLRGGVLSRTLRFRDAEGRRTEWREERFVSMADKHLAAQRVAIMPLDWSGRITVRGRLDGGVVNDGVPRYRGLESRHLEVLEVGHPEETVAALRVRTRQSRLEVGQAMRLRLDGGSGTASRAIDRTDAEAGFDLSVDAAADAAPVVVEKVAALHTARDMAISEPLAESVKAARDAPDFDTLRAAHVASWRRLWDLFDLDVGGADDSALKLRAHIFHLLQTVSFHSINQDTGVPPRGWHGEAYRGHIFWDELFIFPFLNLRQPIMTRALLLYRHRRLGEARRAARAAGLDGAMYPWQSGSNGREESQKVHLNPESGRWIPDDSHRQRHINAAIAYNIWHYWEVTEDRDFLSFHGAEMMMEIARLWASLATWNDDLGRYEIKGVMGPDEYHTAYPGTDPEEAGGLDNNAYTNVMAAWVLTRASDVWDLLPADRRAHLADELDLTDDERARWVDISRRLLVPFHDCEEGRPVISQFSGYEDLEEFDWAPYREKYGNVMRLDRILEAEDDTPNRYKVSKQADVLMLFYLFSAEELEWLFDQLGYVLDSDLIPRTVDYYLKRTSHGSTLSFVTHAWVLARSDRARSWDLFQSALDSDIKDIQGGTTREGIHTGAMAGSVDILQRCYMGLDTRQNVLHVDPLLPGNLDRVTVYLRYRHQRLTLTADHAWLTVESAPLAAAPVHIAYRGHVRELSPGMTVRLPLVDPAKRVRAVDHQPVRRECLGHRRGEVERLAHGKRA
ncbi:Trehalose-6-phosphate phosphatase [Caenispirillum salinarum AK4]|uniref:Trehalose-6-phosphate phosphatase n=2 Tax=Caenispirillum TaxID=414051 RepID=K9H400_9PROT|nr:Trehalose-6-phosphate phosphatase [Caenispirillum salinarum AK4]